jgi:poly(A) polymerase
MIKLLQTGHALKSIDELRRQALPRGLFPILDALLNPAAGQQARDRFVQLALADTDKRVEEGRAVAPSFLLACLLWHDVLERWNALRANGEPTYPALQQAVDAVFDARIGDISGRGKLGADMREIWMMQPRFERRTASAAHALADQPRYRAGYDFLRLRADAQQVDAALAEWWEDFALGNPDEREALLQVAKASPAARRAAAAPAAAEGEADEAAEAASAPRKRRRRRRKPASGASEAATDQPT